MYCTAQERTDLMFYGTALQYTAILFSLKNCILLYVRCISKARILKLLEAQESVPISNFARLCILRAGTTTLFLLGSYPP